LHHSCACDEFSLTTDLQAWQILKKLFLIVKFHFGIFHVKYY